MAHLFRAQHALHRLQAVSAFRSGRQLTPEEGIEAGDFYREVVAAAAAGELLAVTEEQKHAFARPVPWFQLCSADLPSGLECRPSCGPAAAPGAGILWLSCRAVPNMCLCTAWMAASLTGLMPFHPS